MPTYLACDWTVQQTEIENVKKISLMFLLEKKVNLMGVNFTGNKFYKKDLKNNNILYYQYHLQTQSIHKSTNGFDGWFIKINNDTLIFAIGRREREITEMTPVVNNNDDDDSNEYNDMYISNKLIKYTQTENEITDIINSQN